MADNLLIKDAAGTNRTIHTIEDSTSAHYNQSIATDVSGNTATVVSGGQAVVTGTMGALVVAQRDALPAGTNLLGAVSVRQLVSVVPDGSFNWPVSVHPVTQSGTWNVGVNAGTNLMGAVSVRQIVSVQPDGTANWPVSVAGTVNVSLDSVVVSTNNLATINAANRSIYTIGMNYAWDGSVWRILSSDTSGRLHVNASIGGSSALIGSVSISPNGLNIPVSVANIPAVTQSGTWTVQPGNTANTTPWLVSVNGTTAVSIAPPAYNLPVSVHPVTQSGTWNVGINAGTNLMGAVSVRQIVSVQPDGTANWPVSVANTPAVTQSGTWTVQPGNTANTTPWLVSVNGTTAVSVGAGRVSVNGIVTVSPAANFLAALPAGGFAVGGEVSTANGSFSSGVLAPLQLDANGRLKISGTITGGSMTQTVGAAVTTEGYPMLGSDGTNAQRLLTTTGGALIVHVSNAQPSPTGISMTQTVGAAVTTEGYPMLGSDGTNARRISTTTGGAVIVHVSNVQPAVSVGGIVSVVPDGTANWPVSVANTPAVTQSGTWTVQPGNTANTTPWLVSVNGTTAVSIAPPAYNLPVSVHPVTQSGTWNVGLNAGTNLVGAVSVRQIVSVQPDGTANWPVSVANIPAVTQSGTWNVGINAGTNLIGAVSVRQIVSVQPDGTANWPVSVAGTPAVTQSGTWTVQPGNTANTTPWLVSVNGTTAVSIAPPAYNLPVSVHPVTQSGTWTVQPGNTPNTAPWLIAEVPTSTDGLSTLAGFVSANTTGVVVKAAAGKVYGIQAFNIGSTPLYLKLYNKATAPTGSDTPAMNMIVPGNTAGAGVVYPITGGGAGFATGISYRITGGINIADATNPSDNQGVFNIFYK